jgi:hypothetical protein
MIRISRDLVFSNQSQRAPKDAPDLFVYNGICKDHTLAKGRPEKEEKLCRSVSPE